MPLAPKATDSVPDTAQVLFSVAHCVYPVGTP
jgi:hypothetical protein